MNKYTIKLIIFLFLQFLIVFVHLFFIDFLPYPYNHLNLALVFLILYAAIVINPRALWTLLPFICFEELFSSLPFGVNALALLMALLFFNLVLITVLSNRSLPTIILSSIFVVFFYRIFLWIFLKIFNLFSIVDTITINWEWIVDLFWEVLFTTLITAVIYFVLSFFLKRLRLEYITALQKEYEPKRYFRQ